MKVGIDFDGTISADPMTFREVALDFARGGHEVAIVTWRKPPEDLEVDEDIIKVFVAWGFKIEVVYTSGKAKRDCYPADIWIEDNPAAVMFSLEREPRFEVDPAKYNEDVVYCNHPSFPTLRAPWPMLRDNGA